MQISLSIIIAGIIGAAFCLFRNTDPAGALGIAADARNAELAEVLQQLQPPAK